MKRLVHSLIRWVCKRALTSVVWRFCRVFVLGSRVLCHYALIRRIKEMCDRIKLVRSFLQSVRENVDVWFAKTWIKRKERYSMARSILASKNTKGI